LHDDDDDDDDDDDKNTSKTNREITKGCAGCVWVGGVVAFFLRYYLLKAHTTLSKSK